MLYEGILVAKGDSSVLSAWVAILGCNQVPWHLTKERVRPRVTAGMQAAV